VVLQALKWDISSVTPHDFLEQIVHRLPQMSSDDVDTVRRHAQTFIALCTAGMLTPTPRLSSGVYTKMDHGPTKTAHVDVQNSPLLGQQESHAVARKPRDAAAVLFGLKFADNIHYKIKSSQASRALLSGGPFSV